MLTRDIKNVENEKELENDNFFPTHLSLHIQ